MTRSILESSAARRRTIVLALGGLMALGPFTMDLYLPAFPVVQQELRTSQAAVQLTLTATAVGMGVGQLVAGPLSDLVGRRRPLLFAAVLHVLSSIAVAAAPTVVAVSAARFGQGVGAAAGGVVAVAVIRDLYGGQRLVRMLANVALVAGLAPIVAPVLGAQLLLVISWRDMFVLLTGFGILILALCASVVPETLSPELRRESRAAGARAHVGAVFRDRTFVGAAICGSMVFTSIVTYISASPFVFQTELGLNAQQFGMAYAVNAVGLFAATQIAARLMRVIQPAWLLAFAVAALGLSGCALAALQLTHAGLLPVAVASFALVALTGVANPSLNVLTLENHPRRAGTAAAVTGFANSIVGGLVSPLPGLLGGASAGSLGTVVIAAMIVASAAVWLVIRPWTVPRLTD